jgi:hypothetical protein
VKLNRLLGVPLAGVALATGLTVLASTAGAATIDLHVSPAGSDSAAGTPASPLRTIQSALDKARPGTTIHLAPGTYHERLVTRRAGTAAAPITIKGPETGKDSKGRYRAVLLGTSRIVSVDHVVRPRRTGSRCASRKIRAPALSLSTAPVSVNRWPPWVTSTPWPWLPRLVSRSTRAFRLFHDEAAAEGP